MEDFNDYNELQGSGFQGQKPQEAPEEAFFKSIYIAGKPMQIEGTKIRTMPGYLQIRGLEYNLEKVYFIITNIKKILVNEVNQPDNHMKNICFSYDLKNGRKEKVCGSNSAERTNDPFCSTCKSQILVCGIYCDETGQPIKKDKKYNFIFLRAKGIKYSNVSDYLNNLYNANLEPFFEKSNDPEIENKRILFEKSIVNYKRFVTEVSVTTIPSNYGDKDVFLLKTGIKLNNESVKSILNLSKKILEKFNDKFDWNKHQKESNFDSYTEPPAKENQFSDDEIPFDTDNELPTKEKKEEKKTNTPANISFDDIEF